MRHIHARHHAVRPVCATCKAGRKLAAKASKPKKQPRPAPTLVFSTQSVDAALERIASGPMPGTTPADATPWEMASLALDNLPTNRTKGQPCCVQA